MTSIFGLVASGLAAVMLGLLALSAASTRVDRALNRVALELFREHVEEGGWNSVERKRLLQSIHATTTYRIYASKTLLYSVVTGVSAVVIGFTAARAVLAALIANRDAVEGALPEQLHFVVTENASRLPFAGGDGGSGSSGSDVSVDAEVLEPLSDLAPASLKRLVALLGSLVPAPVRNAVPDRVTIAPPSAPVPEEGSGFLIVLPRLDFLPDSLSALSTPQLVLLVILGLLSGVAVAWGTYTFRWHVVKSRAEKRKVLIDESLARTIAFVYALSRSGMVYPEIMRTVARNREAFGEAAEEIAVVVNDMDLFGADLISALQRCAATTPSEQFSDFADNFANVLRSGQNVPGYLRDQYDQYHEDRVANQEQLLELLSALGEAYVALFVAGPLLLIAILTTVGVLTGGLLGLIRLIVYVLIPLASLGFMYYLAGVTKSLTNRGRSTRTDGSDWTFAVRRSGDGPTRPDAATDGGVVVADGARNLQRLAIYQRVRWVRWALKHPVDVVLARPVTLLYVTIPLAVAAVVVRWLVAGAGNVGITMVDDWLIQSALFVVATFAVVQELHARRLRRIEAAVPDFLKSLASTNEAGRTFTRSLYRVDKSDLGALNEELDRLIRDVDWGARTEHALHRFDERVGSSSITRAVALITNAMRASDRLGPVIRIAADEALKDRQLDRKLRGEMSMYVVVVYLSFGVFLVIAIALRTVFVPVIPSAEQIGTAAGGGTFGGGFSISPISEAQKGHHTLILFHAAVVQAVCSGFVAGLMGEGDARHGAKHVTIMLVVAYLLALAFG